MRCSQSTLSSAGRLLLIGMLSLIPATNRALAASVTQFSGDDYNTSTTQNHALIQYYCPWISDSLATFTSNNLSWNFTYAGPTAASFLRRDLSLVAYYPWVVNQPTYSRTFTNPDGTQTTQTWGGSLNGEAGGAYIQLSYTPQGNDPTNIRWIQGIDSSYYGGAFNVHLDNPDDRTSPFYDFGTQDIAGPTYFVDIPGTPENEYEGDPVAQVDFQAFLAQDNGPGNGFAHNVTVYGGIWWDYTYTAVDAPEPASLLLAGPLLLGLIGRKKLRASKLNRVWL